MIGNAKTVARLLGLPYFPVTPTSPALGPLGLVPLPSKWLIAFGEPIETASYGPAAAEDPMLVFNLTDHDRRSSGERRQHRAGRDRDREVPGRCHHGQPHRREARAVDCV